MYYGEFYEVKVNKKLEASLPELYRSRACAAPPRFEGIVPRVINYVTERKSYAYLITRALRSRPKKLHSVGIRCNLPNFETYESY